MDIVFNTRPIKRYTADSPALTVSPFHFIRYILHPARIIPYALYPYLRSGLPDSSEMEDTKRF